MGLLGGLGKLIGGGIGLMTGGPAGAAAGFEAGGQIGGAGEQVMGGQEQGEDGAGYQQSYEQPSQGFDLTQYLPQFANGGVPNKGNPAIIYDMKSMQPTGTMNEIGPERIVPAYDGSGNFSLVDDLLPVASQNMQAMNQSANPNPLMEKSPTSSIGRPDEYFNRSKLEQSEQEDLQVLGDKQKALKDGTDPAQKVKEGETLGKNPSGGVIQVTEKGQEKTDLLGGDFLGLVKGAARMAGYYYDQQRDNYGLGKSGITRFLDWTDAQDAKKKTKDDDLKTYEAKRKIDAKYRKPGESLADYEAKKKIDAKYRAGGAGGKPKYESAMVDDLTKHWGGSISIDPITGKEVKQLGASEATSIDDMKLASFESIESEAADINPEATGKMRKKMINKIKEIVDKDPNELKKAKESGFLSKEELEEIEGRVNKKITSENKKLKEEISSREKGLIRKSKKYSDEDLKNMYREWLIANDEENTPSSQNAFYKSLGED